jgi:hypothetical protein
MIVEKEAVASEEKRKGKERLNAETRRHRDFAGTMGRFRGCRRI